MAQSQKQPLPLVAIASAGTDDVHRDWAALLPEIVSKVADDLLAVDATEYIRLRAVCKPWRRATADPSAPNPRFFPRSWLMLRKDRDDDDGRRPHRFVNVRTGASLRIRLPPGNAYRRLGDAEGLLLLLRRSTGEVGLFNPLTAAMVVAGLPAMPATVPPRLASVGVVVDADGEAPAVVLTLARWPVARSEPEPELLLCAKPGEAGWSAVDASCLQVGDAAGTTPLELQSGLSMRGRFYLPTRAGDVLTVELRPRPRLAYVARQGDGDEYRAVSGDFDLLTYLIPSLREEDGDDEHSDGMLLLRCFDSGFKIWEHTHVAVYGVHVAGGRLHEDVCCRYLDNRTVYLPSRTLVTDKFVDGYLAEGKVWPENCWRLEDAIHHHPI